MSDSPLKLHTLLEQSGIALLPEMIELICQRDITVPHMTHSMDYIRDALKAMSEFERGVNQDGVKAKVDSFSKARRELRQRLSDEAFPELGAVEKMIAMRRVGGMGGYVATSENDPYMTRLLTETCQEIDAKEIPRLLIIKSDMPIAFYGEGPCSGSAMFVSSDLVRILSPLELKAMMGHEIDEKETLAAHPVKKRVDYIKGRLGNTKDKYEHEYHADERGAQTEGGAEAMKSALLKIKERRESITQFTQESKQAFADGARLIVADKTKPQWLKKLIRPPEREKTATHPESEERLSRLDVIAEQQKQDGKHRR